MMEKIDNYMIKMINITGQKFNGLTAIKFVKKIEKNGKRSYYWLFCCECGNEKIIRSDSVISGHAKRCGFCKPCNFIHGMRWTNFYKIWECMKGRCLNYRDKEKYKNYGGRGIKVCDRWLKFENFRDDMYESYQQHIEEFGEKNTTIDRINNNGNYCLGNCRWATWKEQGNNRKTNHLITLNNKTLNITQWAKELNISRNLIYNRISNGWSYKKALTFPKKINKYC